MNVRFWGELAGKGRLGIPGKGGQVCENTSGLRPFPECQYGPKTEMHPVEWRMTGAGEHVLGIEPTNCSVLGRGAARSEGSLVMLAPGEAKTFAMSLELSVS